jgi:Spy/CpxP family protein refolding chaperone
MSSLQNYVAAALLGGAALFAAAPASAQARPAWEAACSYKQPNTSGNGYAVINDACAHLRFCQSMADQGRDGMPMACFGFAPAPRPSDKRL